VHIFLALFSDHPECDHPIFYAFALQITRLPNDPFTNFCGPLPASLSQTPPGGIRFVANKRRSAIRPSGHRAVEAALALISTPNHAVSAPPDIYYLQINFPVAKAGRITPNPSAKQWQM
jgi:hypothetical protein